jgi:hypothetical protein
LPRLSCHATARLTHFPPSCVGRRHRVTTTGTLYLALHRAVPLSSSTDSPEPRGPRSLPVAPLLHRRATHPSQAADGELYRHFPAPTSGHQDPPSHHYPALVCRCAKASRWSSASRQHRSPLSVANTAMAGAAAALLSRAACAPVHLAKREWPSCWANM